MSRDNNEMKRKGVHFALKCANLLLCFRILVTIHTLPISVLIKG